jgi:hypothetical protein
MFILRTCISLQGYTPSAVLHTTPFLCACIKELWVIMIHFLDFLSANHDIKVLKTRPELLHIANINLMTSTGSNLHEIFICLFCWVEFLVSSHHDSK